MIASVQEKRAAALSAGSRTPLLAALHPSTSSPTVASPRPQPVSAAAQFTEDQRALKELEMKQLVHEVTALELAMQEATKKVLHVPLIVTVGYLSFGPIENNIMCFVTSACARRPGAAASVKQRRRER